MNDKAVEQQVFQLPSAGDVQARITLLQAKLSGMPFLLAALRAGQDGPTLKDRVVELVQEGRALDLDGNDGKLIGFGQLPGDSELVEQNDLWLSVFLESEQRDLPAKVGWAVLKALALLPAGARSNVRVGLKALPLATIRGRVASPNVQLEIYGKGLTRDIIGEMFELIDRVELGDE